MRCKVAKPAPTQPSPALTPCADSIFRNDKEDKSGNIHREKQALRAIVEISKNLPITQIEIEVIAGLLDDWESILVDIPEAAE
jgi:hypothetical protein